MSPIVLLVNFSKVVGVAGLLGVAANAISYHRFKNKNLTPFENPIDELQDVLAEFPIDKDVDDGGFFFALATAPAHVEDKLQDAWLHFAKETPPNKDEISDTSSSGELHDLPQTHNKDEAGSSGGGGISDNEKPYSTMEDQRVEVTNSPLLEEWELISQSQEKDKLSPKAKQETGNDTEKEGISRADTEEMLERIDSIPVDINTDQSQMKRGKVTTEEPLLQFNIPKKGKKLVKIAMEAMIRGYEMFVEDDKTNVAAWHNVHKPEQRLRFWSEPETEIKLAKGTNVQVFRMGIDWTRVMPVEPVNGIEQSIDWKALDRYKYIIERVRSHGMKVMLTLFHHSLPPWAGEYGGWKLEKTVYYFLEFTRVVVEKVADLIDFWITFNEPHVFTMLTYCAGAWPGGNPDILETVTSILPKGVYNRVMHMMAEAHLKAYDIIHEICQKANRKMKVGVSHHVSFMRPYGLFDISAVVLTDGMTRFAYIDEICQKLDFIGINYYGQEVVSAPGLKLVENDEYSESGRGVYPDGLYRILLDFNDRYKNFSLPYIITENGISDATDYIRRPYLLEHLLAVRAAMNKGVPVLGYCFWTTSDNWEWADGYGPKFGLVAVDRENNLKRVPRPSYYLFSEVAKTGRVTSEHREKAWFELQIVAIQGKKRPFYRAVDKHGLMYAGGLDIPIERPIIRRDWRFGHYEYDGLQDPISRIVRFLSRFLLIRRRKRKISEQRNQELIIEEEERRVLVAA